VDDGALVGAGSLWQLKAQISYYKGKGPFTGCSVLRDRAV